MPTWHTVYKSWPHAPKKSSLDVDVQTAELAALLPSCLPEQTAVKASDGCWYGFGYRVRGRLTMPEVLGDSTRILMLQPRVEQQTR